MYTAGDVATALAEASKHDLHLLFSDLGLPDGSGVDLLGKLRSRGRTLPAIAVTGYGREEDVHSTHEVGCATHLTKPIDLHQLEIAIAGLARPSRTNTKASRADKRGPRSRRVGRVARAIHACLTEYYRLVSTVSPCELRTE